MFGKFKKKDDYDEYDDDEYEDDEDYDDDEDYEDEDEDYDDDDDYDDEDDDDYDDDEDYDDEPGNPLKGVVIGLAVLAVLLAAVSGLLFMRLKSANAQVDKLTSELSSAREELDALKASSPSMADPFSYSEITDDATAPADMMTSDATPAPDMSEGMPGSMTEPEVTAEVEATPEPSATPEPTPAGTPRSQYIGISTSSSISITTNPEAATVSAGGKATFTAAASNWSWCAWRFVSPDGLDEVIFDKAAGKFPGVTCTGGNTVTITVNNIPASMNGWKAVCLFVDASNGMKVTEGAVITVQ